MKHQVWFNVILDILILITVFVIAYEVRFLWGDQLQPLTFYVPLLIASVLAFLFSTLVVSLYKDSRPLFSLAYITAFLNAYALWIFFLVAFPFFSKMQYSRAIILFIIVFSFIALYAIRLLLLKISPISLEEDQAEVRVATGNLTQLLAVSDDPFALLSQIRSVHTSIVSQAAKRAVDIAGSLVGAIPALLLTPFIVWAIRSDTPGPILIAQKRVGKNGKLFTMYKFRTMFADTSLYSMAPRKDSDPRVTKVGKVLRKYSLDELPQLWNVLNGTMSLVGPRPEMPFIVDKYAQWQRARLRVTPGITGLWQIFGRKDIPLEENLEYDLYYVVNQSFFFDCAIILKTIPHLISSKGAY